MNLPLTASLRTEAALYGWLVLRHGRGSLAQVTGPAGTAALIDQLRGDGVVLTYDPQDRTLRAGGHDTLSVTIGKDH